jgi:hypothetical protein
MSPSLDLDSLRRQYPDMPGWGERVFLELAEIKASLKWTPKDIAYIAGVVGAVVGALKGGGVV